MSFASLLSGSECAIGSNPLQQALKQSSQDASLQRDRFAAGAPIAGPSTLRSARRPEDAARAEEERFMMGAGPSQASFLPLHSVPTSHSGITASHRPSVNYTADNWSREFASMGHMPMSMTGQPTHNAPLEVAQTQPLQQQPAQHEWSSSHVYPSQLGYSGVGAGTYNTGFRMSQPHNSMFYNQLPQVAQVAQLDMTGKGKQKERFTELSDEQWESEFAKVSISGDAQSAAQVEPELEPILDHDLVDDPALNDLDAKWRDIQASLDRQSAMDKEMSAWEAQYGSHFVDDTDAFSTAGIEKFDIEALLSNPPEWQWTTEEESTLKDHPDPFEEGKRLLAAGAPFIQVEQAFEEACKRDPMRSEAWTALGETLAADEKELLAIKALEKAVSLQGRTAGSAWLSLAISYINEGHDAKALTVLDEWIQRAYPSIASTSTKPPQPVVSEEGTYNPWANQQRVIDLFLSAARAGPSVRAVDPDTAPLESQFDADVQVGLGVLFYGNADYKLARDCFEAALSVKPDDYTLWNRLGATLANGGQPEEAISAYRHALSLRPNFTRSLYNLGVSCLNINCYQEAAEHLLAALELQGNEGKAHDGSDSLWQTLRRTFQCMDRMDLVEKAKPETDLTYFKSQGFDF